MKEYEITLGAMFEFVAENLPEDWELSLVMRRGEVDLTLLDPDGESADICLDDLDTGEMVRAYVNHARESDGLVAVAWAGEQDTEWQDAASRAADRELFGEGGGA